MAKLQLNFINGKWVKGSKGRTFVNRSPATGQALAEISAASADDVHAAVSAAATAFRSWRLVPAPRRAEILYRAAEIMRDRKEELARQLTREMGKVIAEARGDIQEGIDMTYYMAGEGRRSFGETAPVEMPNKAGYCLRDPLGVCAAVTPFNFPMAIPTWKTMPALILGNTVVFKPASDTPLTGAAMIEILHAAGLPPGVANLVMGGGEEIGSALLEDPRVSLISFTGSTDTGNEMASQAAKSGKRVSLEMGGKNAVIVMDDADLDLAVEGILWSAFGTTGQRCTAASRVLAHKKIVGRLTSRLVARAKKLRVGDGLDAKTQVGPLINKRAQEKVAAYVEIGKKEGAKLLCGGNPIRLGGKLKGGHYFQPTIFGGVRPNFRLAQEEIFGPVLSVIEVASLDEAVEVNNGVAYGLSASIFTQDVNRAFRAIRDLATGIVYVNAGTTGAEVQFPFGGTRGTGNGHREGGQAALDAFSEWKSVYVDYSGRLQRAQIDR